ncbi:PEP/pyruvate-binding domain-containing protein, partial [Endozoicomonas sp. SESOKO4]|uniref:PEP/pyruvate-binding domain-containing protein n=1 Tax=Endozoicomonas sp. SESOKO4 TaxID=2828745 RepID=UPI002148C68A
QPVIVRSSGINEDNYGDAQAGKYLSVVQGEKDVLSTCLKVMASAYRPEVCSEGIPQPMALIIQHCVDCQYGGVAMSFQSYQDDTVRVEYTPGQPKGVVAGQFGNTPHRIDILREDRKEGTDHYQYVPGKVSSHFILHKDDNGFSEREIFDADVHSNDGGQSLSDDMVSELRKVVTELEDLLLCPVDVEFAIDHQGQLLLLQVRPVTRLSGGMDFTMPIPEENLASGEGISEGYCTGPLWLAKKRQADSMPEGAIVVAHHAEDWMLEPEFIKRAGGFVLAEAGFNDHIAIFLKQEQITLMRAGEQFEALAAQDGQQATLACAHFNGEPGAFIVAGDITEKLASHRSLSSAVSDLPLTTAVPSRDDLSLPEGTPLQVASGFQWLTDQNARLLAFFAPGGGLDCLANPIKMSMSPQRSELLADTMDSVNRLVYGAEALLQGYKTFLMQAGNKCSLQVKLLRDELPLLINRFETLKQTIRSELEPITHLLQAGKEGQVSFCDWVAACHQLQSCLQALNPKEAEQVRSVHELIFAL